MKHGLGKYNQGCRCSTCKEAKNSYMHYWRLASVERDPSTLAHGTLSTYNNYSCRCVDCKAAAKAYRTRK